MNVVVTSVEGRRVVGVRTLKETHSRFRRRGTDGRKTRVSKGQCSEPRYNQRTSPLCFNGICITINFVVLKEESKKASGLWTLVLDTHL